MRTTVIKAVAAESPPRYQREASPTSFTPYEPRVRELLTETPTMRATVLAERVGWKGSIRWFRDNVKRVRPEQHGSIRWIGWSGPLAMRRSGISGSRRGRSRFTVGRMIPTRETEDLLLGSWHLITQLGRVPRRLLSDNEPGIGRGKRHADAVDAFLGTVATSWCWLPPRDPESKGIVESRDGWFETSFMPGRSFAPPADSNEQFTD